MAGIAANGGGRRGDGAETCVGAAPSSRSANQAAVVVLADRFAGGMPERRGEAREARGRCAREACGDERARVAFGRRRDDERARVPRLVRRTSRAPERKVSFQRF